MNKLRHCHPMYTVHA